MKLSDVMDAAEKTTATLPATAEGGSAGVPATVGPRQNFGLDDMRNGGMAVDAWIKVKDVGLQLNDKIVDSLKVIIDTSAIQVAQAIKAGNPAKYRKTYDGVSCATGGTWENALAEIRRIDAGARPYMSADIPMTLVEDFKDSKGKVLLEAGKRIGHTTSTTNRQAFQEFVNQLDKANLRGQEVEVILGYEKMTKTGVNPWGIITFELVGTADSGGDE